MSTLTVTLAEVNARLVAPGGFHELETRFIDGRLQTVYKNLFPTLRGFWLWAVGQHKDKTYIVFESERYTFTQTHQLALKWATVFRDVYGVRKGDRVALCSVNSPEYLIGFWACHLLGAVSVLVNSMLSLDLVIHSVKIADAKLVLLDTKRADMIEPQASSLKTKLAVLRNQEGKNTWNGMEGWNAVLERYHGDTQKILSEDPKLTPEDDAMILYTSGTTGLPKGVLSTQRGFLSLIPNGLTFTFRQLLHLGQDPYKVARDPNEPQKASLIPTPLFHISALATTEKQQMMCTFAPATVVLMRKWNVNRAAKLIKAENVRTIVGVSSLAFDLAESDLKGWEFEQIVYGGSPTHESVVNKARQAFPKTDVTNTYGLTETNGAITGFRGAEYLKRLKSVGPLFPGAECKIVDLQTNVELPAGQPGEIWLRGPGLLKGYWRDPEATRKAITQDGWFRTGDVGHLDAEGYLFIIDRAKDIIIRGGENIDSISVENALYAADSGVAEAAVVAVPDDRLGELPAALVTLKPTCKLSEEQLLAKISKSLPKFAVPVLLKIETSPFPRTPSGKIIKVHLKKVATEEWARSNSNNRAKL